MSARRSALAPAALYPVGAVRPPLHVVDVRAPIEVARGALPFAHALPLMSDDERAQVGRRYAEAGQEAAVALGWEITAGSLGARVEAWRAVVARGPTAVTCWRGGLRSAIACELIDRADARPVDGGYKAVRHHLVDALPSAIARAPLLVLGGLTGAGKTELLARLADAEDALTVVDLEGLARHRGSSFGAHDVPQPAQATFEHELAVAMLLHRGALVLVEDESRYVGRRTLPAALLAAMQRAPLALLEVPLEERVARLHRDYVAAPTARGGARATHAALAAGVQRLRRRLGHQRVRAVRDALDDALATGWSEPGAHRGWIERLLTDYYDRLYTRALEALARPVALRGDAETLARALLARARTLREGR